MQIKIENYKFVSVVFSIRLIFQGLRVAGLFGALLTAFGAIIKLFSIEKDLFYVVLIGQLTAAISQTFILSLPPKIAVTWFKPNEVSSDTITVKQNVDYVRE